MSGLSQERPTVQTGVPQNDSLWNKYALITRRAVFEARRAISEQSADSVLPGHLLVGILRASQITITRHFSQEWTAERFVRELQLPSGPPMAIHIDVPLSPHAKEAINRAVEEAKRTNAPEVTPDHLLLALIDTSPPNIVKVLEDAGITRGSVVSASGQR
jgi:ATP-dependent Clp protease ATP-binding subunit ClpA